MGSISIDANMLWLKTFKKKNGDADAFVCKDMSDGTPKSEFHLIYDGCENDIVFYLRKSKNSPYDRVLYVGEYCVDVKTERISRFEVATREDDKVLEFYNILQKEYNIPLHVAKYLYSLEWNKQYKKLLLEDKAV